MNRHHKELIAKAKGAALEALLHNSRGVRGLPRTAGWGYPEPYTRDLMICAPGILTTGDERLLKSLRKVLTVCAKNQSELGHIPSLVNDREDRGASDTTPLFLMAAGLYRKFTGEKDFLKEAVQRSFTWLKYQSPPNRCLVAQQPTSDWRDEQWVLGYGLFVNTIVYIDLCLFGQSEFAAEAREAMERFTVKGERQHRHVHEGLVLRHKPYYAMWSYKVYRSDRFDLLGNSLAILSGIASPSRSRKLISWIEKESEALMSSGELAADLPPVLFPYIRRGDPDWMPRYEKYNQPGEYHNGGIWPFVCGFYIAALVAAKKYKLAEEKLAVLTELVRVSREAKVEFGFNEWHRAQDGAPRGQDWQSWSAAMYLYAAKCVEEKKTPFFDKIRKIYGEGA
ncbi:MAG: hypothetical protein JW947_01320 [Sedimentisphaerales bacterium]|nr:hypothetical protein [Sedimentisphaerales bacterium]